MFDSKLPNVGTTIFSVMTALAQMAGAVNVSQGFPDYSIDPVLSTLLAEASRVGMNQYAPMPGVELLRQRVAEKYLRCHDLKVDPDAEITITPGGTSAIFCSLAALVRPGDEVIVLEPNYDSYGPSIEVLGGIVRGVPLLTPQYTPDWDAVRDAITDRTRCIVINTPHNPCGSILTREDIEELAALCQRHNIYVISDEVYELITFQGAKHESPFMHEALRERTFVITSFGKTFHVTGWKIGACVAPPVLTKEFRKVHQFVSFCVNAPAQHALAEYMATPDHYLSLSAFFQKKRDTFRELMRGSRWSIRDCSGSYFQLLGYDGITDESDVDFAHRLVVEHGVACIPLSPFYTNPRSVGDKVLRVCFAKSDETLLLAAERLRGV
ncbi:MAG: aminotransferase class I/II-fold pyridoxal phosphate-dependent enzyme [Candidatus Kapabacteria bacterium]|nr:aminotransferase class I/II-fold pyridoxal phosphate-dependent enzyme [Candidatus Kapabacteria bacterium]